MLKPWSSVLAWLTQMTLLGLGDGRKEKNRNVAPRGHDGASWGEVEGNIGAENHEE